MIFRVSVLLILVIGAIEAKPGGQPIGVVYTIDVILPESEKSGMDSSDKFLEKSALDKFLQNIISEGNSFLEDDALRGPVDDMLFDIPEELGFLTRSKREEKSMNPAVAPSVSPPSATRRAKQVSDESAHDEKSMNPAEAPSVSPPSATRRAKQVSDDSAHDEKSMNAAEAPSVPPQQSVPNAARRTSAGTPASSYRVIQPLGPHPILQNPLLTPPLNYPPAHFIPIQDNARGHLSVAAKSEYARNTQFVSSQMAGRRNVASKPIHPVLQPTPSFLGR